MANLSEQDLVERYERIVKSDWFKETYHNQSIGLKISIDNYGNTK